MPDLRPMTVSMMFGRPAMRRMDHRPRVSRCSNLSSQVICGSSFGIHESAPMRMASGVSMFTC
jgi:hypothetical protein